MALAEGRVESKLQPLMTKLYCVARQCSSWAALLLPSAKNAVIKQLFHYTPCVHILANATANPCTVKSLKWLQFGHNASIIGVIACSAFTSTERINPPVLFYKSPISHFNRKVKCMCCSLYHSVCLLQ